MIGVGEDLRKSKILDAVSHEAKKLAIQVEIAESFGQLSSYESSDKCKQVAVYLGCKEAVESPNCNENFQLALQRALDIIPVVDESKPRNQQVPPRLETILSVNWSKEAPIPLELITCVFETLGVLEKERKVFISYRRNDASEVAIQLHDELVKKRFHVFLDRFQVASPQEIQFEITEAMEDAAFVILLYSPDMPNSYWVNVEITQALKSGLPILVVKWINAKKDISKVTQANFPTVYFDPSLDFDKDNALVKSKLSEILSTVEKEHYMGLLRRRREAVDSIKESAKRKKLNVSEYPGWNLEIVDPCTGKAKLIAITPRLSRPEDLYKLDKLQTRNPLAPAPSRALLQVSTELSVYRINFLTWTINKRNLIFSSGVNSIDNFL